MGGSCGTHGEGRSVYRVWFGGPEVTRKQLNESRNNDQLKIEPTSSICVTYAIETRPNKHP
jgi:hypothetical protein